MLREELINKLSELRSLPAETETVEFKAAKNSFDFHDLGKYFSALSNEANLTGKKEAWLVFGISDKSHNIVGTNYKSADKKSLDKLKGDIGNKTTNRITFIEIHELNLEEGRVLLFQIPSAPKGIPIAFDGHYYGRDGNETVPLNIEEIERIRSQANHVDWSSIICKSATIEDLDKEAILQAKANFKIKFPALINEVDSWNDTTFLNKAKITIKGSITNTAILLLGKAESEHFLNPTEAKIRWVLKDSRGIEKDFEIFTCPLLLSIGSVFKKIRNLKYRYIREESIFPEEVNQYEPYVIREALNNCIAHQDYSSGGRINVIESDDELIFTNRGNFIPGSLEAVIHSDSPEEVYRNPFLATAMLNLNMVDTIGSGIKKMFSFQRSRFFPMPDFDLSNNRVKVTITGKVLDLNFARILSKNPELTLDDIIMLDKVQKRKVLLESELKRLRSKGFVEGKKPNIIISAKVAQTTGQKASYTRNKAFSKQQYFDWIIKGIKDHGSLSRRDIEELLQGKLSDLYDEKQKKNKITNLISELRINGLIVNTGSYHNPKWVLTPKD